MIDLKRNSKKELVPATGKRTRESSIYKPNQKDDFNLDIFEQKKFLVGLLILSIISILPIFLKKFNLLKL